MPLALLGGLLVGLNPCCLGFYPAVTATCCSATGRPSLALRNVGCFVAGTASATTVAGISAALAGHALVALGKGPRYALAFVPLLMGLHLLGWLRVPVPARALSHTAAGLVGAFFAGACISLVIGACGTPVFAAILSYAAYTGNVTFGGALLFMYGIGNGLPLLAVGTGVAQLTRGTRGPAWQRRFERVAAVLLLALGFYLLARA